MLKELMKLSQESYSISQKIWSSTDVILLIFAGSAAEFAAIKVVDWLFYTNRLPSAPVERLFDTARFAQFLFFSKPEVAQQTLDKINKIHGGVEKSRKQEIPNWAYKDVLFMLIDYSERAYEIVFGKMKQEEKVAYFEAAMEVGKGMNLQELPKSYDDYLLQRKSQLSSDYESTHFTDQLFLSYKKHLGSFRYQMLKVIQASILPSQLAQLLGMKPWNSISFLLRIYHYFPGGGEKLKLLHKLLLPKKYYNQLKSLGKFNRELDFHY